MTERFKLAANVLLSRRLNHLLRIDENVEIDKGYITCAEYQLFIDEKRAAGENRQPDHWTSEKFPSGDAKKPIAGVRAGDAKDFCEWLTQQYAELGVKYRLPTSSEAEENPTLETQVGCWCKDGQEFVVAGIQLAQWQVWQVQFAQLLVLNLNIDLNCVLNIDLNCVLNIDLNCVLNIDLNRVLKRDLKHVLVLNLKHDLNLNRVLNRFLNLLNLNLNLNRDLYRVLNRVLSRDLNRDLYRVLNRVLSRDLNRDLNLNRDLYHDRYHHLYRNLKHDLNLNRDLNLNLNRDLYHQIEDGTASDFLLLYFPLLFLTIVYHLLSVIYEEVSKDRQVLEILKISRQDSKTISRKYATKRDELYPLYVFLVLLDERQVGRMPAWEGIRIVRERVE